MTHSNAEGPAGFSAAVLTALAMAGAACLLAPAAASPDASGIAFPPPETWIASPLWNAVAGTALIAAVAAGMILFNRRFNFIPSTGEAYASAFMLMACSMPAATQTLSSSMTVAAATLVMLWYLFSLEESKSPPAGCFLLGTVPALGALVEQAFIPLALVPLLCLIALKQAGWRQTLSFIFGLAAPYWIGFGFGLLTPGMFRLPQFTPVWTAGIPEGEETAVIETVFTAFAALMLMMAAIMRVFNANYRVRSCHTCVNLFGIAAILLMLFDSANFSAYTGLLFLFAALQLGDVIVLYPGVKAAPVMLAAALVYIVFLILNIYV